ncbi:Retrotransposon polyprotein [Penicillium samsonianum]|uniref:Retrotransposon polyprotein n=1 Tax=Penicillium samsonianum TaxID=1882272 RepID=UPI0025490FC4|nr:Retrotransposon polyprotein [Penicillium samsonianum]KAJ6138759.1 Retrotransposon polyprotein [Penicillium samsonianum]
MYLDINQTKLPTEASKGWFEPYIRDYYEKEPSEWLTTTTEVFGGYYNFRKHLKRTFGDIDAARTAERKLQKIRQQTSASVYASEFQQIISYLDLPDRAYIPYFEAGLKPDVKDELARIDRPDTLDKLIKIAVKIDNRINERKYERREMD